MSVFRISASFTFSLVSNLTIMLCATAEGTTCSRIVIINDKKQVHKQRYVITVKDFLPLPTNKVILFHTGISTLEEKKMRFISELLTSIKLFKSLRYSCQTCYYVK